MEGKEREVIHDAGDTAFIHESRSFFSRTKFVETQ